MTEEGKVRSARAHRAAARLARVGAWEIDLKSQQIWASEEALSIFGRATPPSVQEGLCFYPPEVRPVIESALRQLIEDGRPYDLSLPFINHQGDRLWVRTIGELAYDQDGDPSRVFGVMQDETRRRQIEVLNEAQQLFLAKRNEGDVQTSLEPLWNALVLLRVPVSHVLYVPLAASGRTEVGFSRTSSSDWMPFLGRHSDPNLWSRLEEGQIVAADWPAFGALFPRSPSGETHAVCSSRAFLWVGLSEGASLNSFEIEGVSRVARHLDWVQECLLERDHARSLDAQVQRMQRMEAIGRLAGGIAHDFNNLLMVIRATCELRSITGNFSQEDIICVDEAASRGQELTQHLLEFARSVPTESIVVDLNRIARSTTRLLVRLAGEHIKVVEDLYDDGLPVMVERGQLERVVLNIGVNARDAMPDGGTLTFRSRRREFLEHDAARPLEAAPGSYAELVIEDTGIGMERALAETIFEPYMTTKALGKGTGLGLAMAHGAVSRFKGSIRVDSEPGEGSRFTILLPLVEDAARSSKTPNRLPATHRFNGNVLVVEDEPTVRRIAAEMLEVWGFRVICAEGQQSALAQLESLQGSLALLLSDVVMPDGNGPSVARAVRERYPDVPVIFMSGHVRVRDQQELKQIKMSSLLQKPFSNGELFEQVTAHFDGNFPDVQPPKIDVRET